MKNNIRRTYTRTICKFNSYSVFGRNTERGIFTSNERRCGSAKPLIANPIRRQQRPKKNESVLSIVCVEWKHQIYLRKTSN